MSHERIGPRIHVAVLQFSGYSASGSRPDVGERAHRSPTNVNSR